MSEYQDRMKDYVPVNERISAFMEAHPEGSIQSEIVELTETRVTVKAYAYRTAEDTRPGVGHSSLGIPGSTPYTKGSEIENAETSAWGRAIAALGFEVKRGIASSEDVRNKQPSAPVRATVRPEAGVVPPRAPAPADDIAIIRDRVIDILHERHLDADALQPYADRAGVVKGERATLEQWQAILAAIDKPESGEQASAREASPATTPALAPDEAGQLSVGEVPPSQPAEGTVDPASTFFGEQVAAATGGELLPANPAAGAIAKAQARAAKQKVTA